MSLREMFVGLTAAAVFCWCMTQAGVGNGYFWLATGVAAGMSYVWWRLARRREVRWLAPLVPVVFVFFCGILLASLTTLALGALLCVAGIVCAIAGPLRGKTLAYVAVGCFLAAFVTGGIEGRRAVRELDLTRRRYPFESLAAPLAYEQDAAGAFVEGAPLTLASSVESSLQDAEQGEDEVRDRPFGRNWTLKALHERTQDKFVRAAGFGVGRMRLPHPSRVERPELADVAFDGPSEANTRSWQSIYRERQGEGPDSVHLLSRDDFLSPESFGWVESRLVKVAGFVPHAFHRPVQAEEPATWTVERLELVSLLKFDRPRVYVLDHLPRMDQLSGDDVPTRGLDAFEERALADLRTEEDVVVEAGGDATRMLGSLRAGRACLECHSVQRGALLGAFSYVLRGEAGRVELGREAAGGEELGASGGGRDGGSEPGTCRVCCGLTYSHTGIL